MTDFDKMFDFEVLNATNPINLVNTLEIQYNQI